MLQQTPVARVLPVWRAVDVPLADAGLLAAEPAGEAVRAWGRLGYPRRALRLHAAAGEVTARHGGELPATVAELLSLPGIGDYTARAVVAFAHRERHPVVDTNVRRVVARALEGRADAPVTRRDLDTVLDLLPPDGEAAATASVAVMELGALVCTARAPDCPACPLRARCAWLLAGRPASTTARRTQAWAGTDRQARGRLLAVLRGRPDPVAGRGARRRSGTSPCSAPGRWTAGRRRPRRPAAGRAVRAARLTGRPLPGQTDGRPPGRGAARRGEQAAATRPCAW